MANFKTALDFLLKCEGGFVDNPDDHGGPTNKGITLRTLQNHRWNQTVLVSDLQALTDEEAGAIYKPDYWDTLNLDALKDDRLALILFNLAVLRGVPAVIRSIQKVLGLTSDGKLGPETAIRMQSSDAVSLGLGVIFHSEQCFVDLSFKDPTQIKFLHGWISRTHALLRILMNAMTYVYES